MSTQPCGCDPEEQWMCEFHIALERQTDKAKQGDHFPIRGLPVMDSDRKKLPVFTGVLMYFPDAMLAVAEVSRIGNEQHNPGEPLHWARDKSTDQTNTALRHMMDHGLGNTKDTDGAYHLAKAIWRLSAELQLTIERDRANETSHRR